MKEGEKGLPEGRKEKEKGGKREKERENSAACFHFSFPSPLPISLHPLSPVATSCPVQPPPQCRGAGTPAPWGRPCRGPLVAPCPPLEMETKLPRAAAEHPPAPPNPLARLLIPKGSVSPLFFSQPKFSGGSPGCPWGLSPWGEDEPQHFAGF